MYWITSLRKISKDHLSHFLTNYRSTHIENKCLIISIFLTPLPTKAVSIKGQSVWIPLEFPSRPCPTWRACCRLWASKCSAWVKPLGIEDHISVALLAWPSHVGGNNSSTLQSSTSKYFLPQKSYLSANSSNQKLLLGWWIYHHLPLKWMQLEFFKYPSCSTFSSSKKMSSS